MIEAGLFYCDVGHVRAVSPLAFPRTEPLLDHGNGKAEPLIDRTHPGGVAAGQIVVIGEHVHAAAGEGVERHGRHGREGLAFAGLHLHQLALVHGEARQELHLVRPLAEHPAGRLAHDREALWKQRVERLAGVGSLFENRSPRAQFAVRQPRELRLEGVNGVEPRQERRQFLARGL